MGAMCFRSSSVNSSPELRPSDIRVYRQSRALPEIAPSASSQPQLYDSSFFPIPPFRRDKSAEELEETEGPFSFESTDAPLYRVNGNNTKGDKKLARAFSSKARSAKSRTSLVARKGAAKVNEVGSLLGRAGAVGLNKAVEALDTLGSSMTNIGSGFASGTAPKGNKIGILAFEVANTIVKGFNLKQSLSEENIRILKEETLHMECIQHLVSTDMAELLRLAAADKRNELKIFAGEVVRFGNHCRDPQWHQLDRYFFSEKLYAEALPRKTKEEALREIHNLITLAQNTAELYHELHALDRFETDYRRKLQEEEELFCSSQKGDSLAVLRNELKSQKRHVKELKKRSLWSKILEEVVEKLVEIVSFLNQEIQEAFGDSGDILSDQSKNPRIPTSRKLGDLGLALHYANIINQIDNLVSRPSGIPPNSRDTLYQNLPPPIKLKLRSRLQKSHLQEEFTIPLIKAEMEKTLSWLVPMAASTINWKRLQSPNVRRLQTSLAMVRAHHGFGWVGEWANTGSAFDHRLPGHHEFLMLQTLHHANQQVTEEYILDLIVWLHHLVSLARSNMMGNKSPVKSPSRSMQKAALDPPNNKPSTADNCGIVSRLSPEDEEMLRKVKSKKFTPGISKSQEFRTTTTKVVSRHDRLSKSSSLSPRRPSENERPFARRHAPVAPVNFETDKMRALDVIDNI